MKISTAVVVLAILVAPGGVSAQSVAETGEDVKSPERFWIDLGLGWAWTRGNDVRVAQLATATVSDDAAAIDAEFQPLRTQLERDTALLVRAGFAGETWGIDGSLWRLGPRGSTDTAYERKEDDPTFPTLVIWNVPMNTPGDYSLTAGNEISLGSGRVELTRSVGSKVSLAAGLHVARFENDRSELLTVNRSLFSGALVFTETTGVTTDARGWMFGPSLGVRVAADAGQSLRLSLSLSQSILFSDIDHGGAFSGRTEIQSGQLVDES